MVSMVQKILKAFRRQPVAVLGDIMLDTHCSGRPKKISPEAPVLVMEELHTAWAPGGAANVACNIQALGSHPTLIGRVGKDVAGATILKELTNRGIAVSKIQREKQYATPVKKRFWIQGKQLLRVDREDPLAPVPIKRIPRKIFGQQKALLISDYAKGFLSSARIQEAIGLAHQYSMPILVDPKNESRNYYKGSTLLKPNKKEAAASFKDIDDSSILTLGKTYLKDNPVPFLVITDGAQGLWLFEESGAVHHVPSLSREEIDSTGAGDMVLAILGITFANDTDPLLAATLANLGAGISIGKRGCGSGSVCEILHHYLQANPTAVTGKLLNSEELSLIEPSIFAVPPGVLHFPHAFVWDLEILPILHTFFAHHRGRQFVLWIEGEALPSPLLLETLAAFPSIAFILHTQEQALIVEGLQPDTIFPMQSLLPWGYATISGTVLKDTKSKAEERFVPSLS